MPNRFEIGFSRVGHELFKYPREGELQTFSQVMDKVNALPFGPDPNDRLSLSADFMQNGQETNLTVTAMPLHEHEEDPTQPLVIFLPIYGEESRGTQRRLALNLPEEWNSEGIETFHTVANVKNLLSGVSGSQYAYALGLRMIHERIKDAHHRGQRVALVGFSYGAHLISAYLSQSPDELPDAIVAVAGGDIKKATLQSPFSGRYDPATIDALNKNPDLLPQQYPLPGELADITFVATNSRDIIAPDQERIWGSAKYKRPIPGEEGPREHLAAPARIRELISEDAEAHLRRLLLDPQSF